MYKPCSNFLLILVLVICLLNARAQSPDWYRGSINRPYQLAGDFKDARLYPIGSEPDSIKLQITSLADVQAFIAKGLQNKVYAIGVDNKARPDLTAIFSLVLSFPKLAYIRIIDREFPSDNDKAYQLPDGVKKLKNLKGFEFDYTDKIDMPNALTKLKLLRNLQILVFTEYEHKLPSVINQLRQVKTVDLSTHNIGDNDLAPVNWEAAKIWGDHIRASGFPYVIDPGQEDALKRLANVKSLRKLDVYLYHLWDTTVLSRFTQIKSLSFGCDYLYHYFFYQACFFRCSVIILP